MHANSVFPCPYNINRCVANKVAVTDYPGTQDPSNMYPSGRPWRARPFIDQPVSAGVFCKVYAFAQVLSSIFQWPHLYDKRRDAASGVIEHTGENVFGFHVWGPETPSTLVTERGCVTRVGRCC